jgi:hypothetical protein
MKGLGLVVILTFVLVACGSGSKSSPSATNINTQLSGSWTITATESGSTDSVFSVNLVSSQCSVSTPVGTFTVQGPSCVIADDNTGQGSISGTGQFIYPPQGVLVGATAGSIAANASAPIDLLFVEANQYGDVAVFNGNGTVTNGSMTGTWVCNVDSPSCSGLNGTFSGNQN